MKDTHAKVVVGQRGEIEKQWGEFEFEIKLLRERIRKLELGRENSKVAGKKHGLGLGHEVQKEPIPNQREKTSTPGPSQPIQPEK